MKKHILRAFYALSLLQYMSCVGAAAKEELLKPEQNAAIRALSKDELETMVMQLVCFQQQERLAAEHRQDQARLDAHVSFYMQRHDVLQKLMEQRLNPR